jgi:hypothetical protein
MRTASIPLRTPAKSAHLPVVSEADRLPTVSPAGKRKFHKPSICPSVHIEGTYVQYSIHDCHSKPVQKAIIEWLLQCKDDISNNVRTFIVFYSQESSRPRTWSSAKNFLWSSRNDWLTSNPDPVGANISHLIRFSLSRSLSLSLEIWFCQQHAWVEILLSSDDGIIRPWNF